MECEPNSNWKLKHRLPNYLISSWFSHNRHDEHVTIMMEFEDYAIPITYDAIHVNKDHVEFRKIRENHEVFTERINVSISGGWVDFDMDIESTYTLRYLNNIESLFKNISVDFSISFVHVQGSNCTVNCKSDMRVWRKDSKRHLSVPVDDSKAHWLGFYSAKPYAVKFTLAGRHFELGSVNGQLTTNTAISHPLTAFKEHLIMIECKRNQNVFCDIKNSVNFVSQVGKEMMLAEEEISLKAMPDFISFSDDDDSSYDVILRSKDPRIEDSLVLS
ncbi:hypothetical protein SK128_026850 [Halocaridina rubra]|uniref:Uncharacterized protein n=1 Tax=Halocaridina rubra TaxID=373956 RepID=A0AAN8WWU5_HALRR